MPPSHGGNAGSNPAGAKTSPDFTRVFRIFSGSVQQTCNSGARDEAWFKRDIAPKLDAFSLKEIANATGYRPPPARASGRARRCRTRGIGRRCGSSLTREVTLFGWNVIAACCR
jgi:hypothetical protein